MLADCELGRCFGHECKENDISVVSFMTVYISSTSIKPRVKVVMLAIVNKLAFSSFNWLTKRILWLPADVLFCTCDFLAFCYCNHFMTLCPEYPGKSIPEG